VLAVLRARDIADLGVPDFTLEDLLDSWRASEFDLATDALLTQAPDGRIVAYSEVRRQGSLANVDPASEGLGIGTTLLAWTEQRERVRGGACHRQRIAANNSRGGELLKRADYTRARSNWRMAVALAADSRDAQSDPPPGVEIRELDTEGDAAGVHQLDAVAFAQSPDYAPESLPEFREEHLGGHDHDPGLSCVALRHGRLAGFILSRRWEDESVGYVDILAVHPDHQRRGIASAMLRWAFAAYAGAGLGAAQLTVASDNPRALALYERVGMSPRFRLDIYERPIDPGTRA
jgi:ribosomal protein S18 acetylase RimI-like enzyme